MKFYALLAALAAVSVTHTEAFIGHDGIDAESLAKSIDETRESLKKYKSVDLKNAEDNLRTDFDFRQKDADELTQASVDELAKELKAAKEEGKDIAQCEKSMNSETEAALDKQLADIKKCFEAYSLNFTTFPSQIDAVLKKANKLQLKLDNIVKECENNTFPQICTFPQLFQLKFSIRSWKSEGQSVENTQQWAISKAKSKISRCHTKLSASYKKSLNAIKTKALKCLAELKQDKTTPSTVPETPRPPPIEGTAQLENPSP